MKKTPKDRIIGFIQRRNATTLDFSEPYMFNCPATVRHGDHYYGVEKISLDGDTVRFFCYDYTAVNTQYTEFTDTQLSEQDLCEVADWLNYNRHYINRHAVIS